MKKSFILLAILQIVTLSLFANSTITKKYDFGTIKSIDASSIYEIEVTEGHQKGVTIVCDSAYEGHLEVKYFQGELILAMKPNVQMINNLKTITEEAVPLADILPAELTPKQRAEILTQYYKAKTASLKKFKKLYAMGGETETDY